MLTTKNFKNKYICSVLKNSHLLGDDYLGSKNKFKLINSYKGYKFCTIQIEIKEGHIIHLVLLDKEVKPAPLSEVKIFPCYITSDYFFINVKEE